MATTTQTPRVYTGKDVDMLISVATIADSAIIHKADLQEEISVWTDPYFETVRTNVDEVIKKHLGIDGAKKLRKATTVVTGIQKEASVDLAMFKTQITTLFKKDKPKMLAIIKDLGFDTYLKQTRNGDQEAMISLLFQFVLNLPDHREDIETKGANAPRLERIIKYAETLSLANIKQEGFKGTKLGITAAAIKDFNDIYNEVIGICAVASKKYLRQPTVKALFTYTKVLKALNAAKKAAQTTDTPK